MRTRVIAVLFLTILCAPALFANCQECDDYYDWQANEWCLYCAPSECGFYQCNIGQYNGVMDYCQSGPAGNDQCYTPNVGCVAEPQALNFDETWRLKDVRVFRSKQATAAAPKIG